MDLIVIGILIVAVVALSVVLGTRLRGRGQPSISIQSSIEQIREIGHLSVFKIFTKEIVTASKHDWGDVGSRYFGWILTTKKMAMVFEFQIDFRYDLRSPEFTIQEAGRNRVIIRMPQCMTSSTDGSCPGCCPIFSAGSSPGGFRSKTRTILSRRPSDKRRSRRAQSSAASS
jgi:hypothetical protein